MIMTRQSSIRQLILSLLVVSVGLSKGLHLLQHISSIPGPTFALYFPTFLILETLLCISAWIFLFKCNGVKAVIGIVVAAAISSLSLVLCASQIAFYLVTGNEIRWEAAAATGSDPEGARLLLSGTKSFMGAASVIFILSWLFKNGIYCAMNFWFCALFTSPSTEKGDKEALLPGSQDKPSVSSPIRLWTIMAVITTATLRLTRPQVPYNHMSGAIPFTLFQALRPSPTKGHGDQEFPLASLIGEEYWEGPHGHFKGWAPGMTEENHTVGHYNAVDDPLRITNLDHDMIEPLTRALKDHDIPITHVVLVLMESARKDIFPFKAGSHLHEEILSSWNSQDPQVLQSVNERLSNLTPVAEKLTGQFGGFMKSQNDSQTRESQWEDTAASGMGGINIDGILTGSTLSFKSAIMNYCGMGPLPVDFMDEVKAKAYQPCIMQVFDLFNQLKQNETAKDQNLHKPHGQLDSIHLRNWTSVFLQSITGLYDDQDQLNEKMGFKKSIYREQIEEEDAKHFHPGMEEINYFGYPEHEILPYLRDVVNNTLENNERLFLSHFTSTTHHPWGTPKDYPTETYFSEEGLMAKHEEMNQYLNAVRYVDTWLGDMMKVLEEFEIANETLVVFVGDHGQAFDEDAPVSGTYENGHISNFRIPLLFRHPLLPKLQITANATSMSVVPTILDLLVQTGSLNKMDSSTALDLMNEYEGQSLIRPYQATHNGRQAWNFGIINPGGTMLSVGSAAVPYRFVLPLSPDFEYIFSDLDTDPNELAPLRGWSLEELIVRVRKLHGDHAGNWLIDAEKVGKYWVEEQKRRWDYQ
ncbi:uncharacterized protein N7511_009622 [Penicillium nucicola]|uniref:uncharacterized protein n=1 Tax=Penicillium nucicola TaxID=1850975 RepID=UPI0025456159|nr:uncharacterized protein N7511_009622 [Penicillium nucicola]KAJ5747926.1 hypothetical protein N7511_009622 [Penicillium nucicola]